MTRLKVLMADDEPDVLTIMAKKVIAAGYDVIMATDGQQAWDKIVADDPDVILLDVTMPKLDGFEVLKRLRENPPSKKWQPVIIVSAREELQDIQKGFFVGSGSLFDQALQYGGCDQCYSFDGKADPAA
jgi:CheY-like chemotaxis protein